MFCCYAETFILNILISTGKITRTKWTDNEKADIWKLYDGTHRPTYDEVQNLINGNEDMKTNDRTVEIVRAFVSNVKKKKNKNCDKENIVSESR